MLLAFAFLDFLVIEISGIIFIFAESKSYSLDACDFNYFLVAEPVGLIDLWTYYIFLVLTLLP